MTMTTRIAALTLACAAAAPAQAVDLLVPAYFYPSANPSLSLWTQLTAAAAAGAHITAIANPNNGPDLAFNSDYNNAINAFRAAGGKVLGYVYTCYAGTQCNPALPQQRSVADVLADAQKYAQWYSVDGIFLDEMSRTTDQLPFYADVAAGLRAAQPQWRIFGNPGTAVPADFLAVADTLVTFENGTGTYAGSATEPWMASAAPSRQAHLHHSVASAADMLSLLQQAQARNAGYVYITDDLLIPGSPTENNPWDRLPSYFGAELAAVSAVPQPPALVLALAGLALLRFVARRR